MCRRAPGAASIVGDFDHLPRLIVDMVEAAPDSVMDGHRAGTVLRSVTPRLKGFQARNGSKSHFGFALNVTAYQLDSPEYGRS
jgi:hypothetical protein